MASTGFGSQLLGTILCGFVFAIPIFIIYFIVKWVIGRIERRKARIVKEHTVV
ncbi:MAG: hypothetical protein ACFFDW_12885 [Candidatus Thorarchaeota archaeon]